MPISVIAMYVVYCAYDSQAPLHFMLNCLWLGIPVFLFVLAALALISRLGIWLESSSRRELGEEIEKNEAVFTAANRPGGWKQYYGVEPEAADPAPPVIPDHIRRHGWQASYSEAGDRLAEVAQQHRAQQQQQRLVDNREWLSRRSLREREQRK